jgi:hypothetical protein
MVTAGEPPAATGYDPGETDGSGVYVLCDWPYGDRLAVTMLSHDSLTGQVVDADILVNGEKPLSMLTEGASHRPPHAGAPYDLAAVLTHEMGHVLGLDESDVPEATMWPKIRRGDTEPRTLAPDDEQGVEAIYLEARFVEAPGPDCSAAGRLDEEHLAALAPLLFGLVLRRIARRRRGAQ